MDTKGALRSVHIVEVHGHKQQTEVEFIGIFASFVQSEVVSIKIG